MILVIKKDKIALIALIFLLSVAVISLNIASGQNAVEVANDDTGKRTVVIDAGHGGEDPGAVSDYSGLKEKDVNLIIAKKVRELLEAENYNVIMTREEDVLNYKEGTQGYTSKRGQDLTARKKLIDESGADIAVSIHLNKFSQTQYHGAQVFFPPRSEESKRLADIIQKSLRDNVDPENKREALVKDTKLIILKNLKVPTVIVECGFLSNQEEEKKLADKDYQEKLAIAIKEGIVKYFEQQ
ncbi:N-acetylmuramoyl-L-alanine amidase CwlD [Acetivibrio straminisolvens]|jgi:N-acetylmuramoyl-L-alanine amidase|uniref:N-acetylmuramoyl-L-alanine amidase n=1 Tax=Acetivibrio straminisolvens JCM 21531 TaxID=1294263 RepID=W4V8I3_9FIRM|nr:N-acetylmuramoyl-L-alanine amidase CwlD [Acetivibrio straminisolvens]GAE89466.1 N-acetylmuramoyl-L-alanine amidase [Acetivibrio straminisolvens JCM 21531]